jgi:hypothetical protein
VTASNTAMVMALQRPTWTGGTGGKEGATRYGERRNEARRGNPRPAVMGISYTTRWPTNAGGPVMGCHHASRVGEGPGATVGRQGPEAGGCRRSVASACCSDRGERG